MSDNSEKLYFIVSQFEIEDDVLSVESYGEGFINTSYFVRTSGKTSFLLQMKNKEVFHDVPAMVSNILKISRHLGARITREGGDPLRQSLQLVKTKNDNFFYKDEQGDFWVLNVFIENAKVFEKVDSEIIAFEGGRGIALFHKFLDDFREDLTEPIPGFHNLGMRFKQWDEILNADPLKRLSRVEDEVCFLEKRRSELLDFSNYCLSADFPGRVCHNDTKISNILFNHDNTFLCMIDLDTASYSPVINDFGDAVRSYANTGKEDERDITKVKLDLSLFSALARGYLGEAVNYLTQAETRALGFAGNFIVYEQSLRFLMDYINGDKYYKIFYPDQNLLRARAQIKYLSELEKLQPEIEKIIRKFL